MKVILDIPDENLAFLGEQAKNIRQSRKAYMENILIQLAQPKIEKPHNQNKAIVAPISVRDVENHDPDKKIAPIQRKTTPAVNIQNFTNNQNTNKAINTESPSLEELRELLKEVRAEKCPGWANVSKFRASKEQKIEEIEALIEALKNQQNG